MMNPTLLNLCLGLDALEKAIIAAWADDRTLNQAFGWNCPALNRHDLAGMARTLAEKIRQTKTINLQPALEDRLRDVQRNLAIFITQSVPQMFNGNAYQAVSAYTSTLIGLELLLEPIFDWQILTDNKALPPKLIGRLRAIQAEIELIVPNKSALEAQIRKIAETTEAADNFPHDLQRLAEVRREVENTLNNTARQAIEIGLFHATSKDRLDEIEQQNVAANLLAAKCEEAYRITTTKGLAAAFDQRALSLARSMWVWVFGLFASLATGAVIGAERINFLSNSLKVTDPQWGVIWLQLTLSVLTVAGPFWFSWLATKQIGQRFRLAEDYAFKASVAKAYEGYRREAARIDELFEARLFSAALSRLEEPPLRLVEDAAHGSPWHDLINSEAFMNALNIAPSLREKFMEVAKGGISLLDQKLDKTKISTSQSKNSFATSPVE